MANLNWKHVLAYASKIETDNGVVNPFNDNGYMSFRISKDKKTIKLRRCGKGFAEFLFSPEKNSVVLVKYVKGCPDYNHASVISGLENEIKEGLSHFGYNKDTIYNIFEDAITLLIKKKGA